MLPCCHQERLQAAVAQRSIEDLEASLQAASQAYVQASNTKPLFRDVIIEDDYNPLVYPLVNRICIPTADLVDPLLHDLVKAKAEKDLLSTGGRATTGSHHRQAPGSCYGLAKATTRPMLETTRWAAGQIHATPYGHCINDNTAEYMVR